MTQPPPNQIEAGKVPSPAEASLLKIKILPRNLEAGSRPGEVLLDVLRRTGVSVPVECGTQGVCGRCVVQILSGQCDWSRADLLPVEKVRAGFVLSCQARVREDLVVLVPETCLPSLSADLTPSLVPEMALDLPPVLSPLARTVELDVAPVLAGEQVSDLDRLVGGWANEGEIGCQLAMLQSVPEVIRRDQGRVTMTFVDEGTRRRLLKLESGLRGARRFGVACDIGTTTVGLQVVDLTDGRVIDTVGDYNGQIECGADVISRILYAQKSRRLAELQRRVVHTINRLLTASLARGKIAPDDVTCAVFAGNTTMTHLFLGIDPRHIREHPFVPALKTAPLLSAKELDLHIWPEAPVWCAPCVGSYVGGDITAGALRAQLYQPHRGITLFIDIGTNGELVLSGGDWMIGCACSAGPAFEGGGISCGMRAAPGAIESVDVQPGGAGISFRVIGGGPPQGICGSGLLELVAGLFTRGVIGRDGRFTEAHANDRVRLEENPRAFVVVEASQSATGKAVCLNERDIANLMRAKAAIYSACSLFLKKVGVTRAEIQRVYIAGGFGHRLDVPKAITLGLFPDLALDRFEYLGNTSLQGAYLALLSQPHRRRLAEIARTMTYLDLSSEPDYLPEYTAAMFLPHTDATLFPSVISQKVASSS
jgi:uncharacterized 2Fe-2S/4Fe-4S cluster protein (DUF4445 family)